MVIWFIFLIRVARLDLDLLTTHADRCAGLGFLGQCAYGFGPVLFAEGTLLSAMIADRVQHGGAAILDYKMTVAAVLLFLVATALGPLLVFSPLMARAKLSALTAYGSLASRYVEDFRDKWVRRSNPDGEKLLGTPDIQSLADISNSYAVLQGMRPVPFDLWDAGWILGAAALPLLPLSLFVFSVSELLGKLISILF
jgi:hypothetical protein